MRQYKHIAILSAILILGFFLRLHNLGKESLWLDEGDAIRLSGLPLGDFIQNVDIQAPLYFKLLHFWILLFGNSAYAARFFSLIFGGASIFMVYQIGAMLFDRETGLLAALLTSLSTFQVQYSQEVKYYSLISLLVLISFYYLLKLVKKFEWPSVLFYLGSSLALMYIISYWVFILAAQNIFFFTMLARSRNESLSFRKWLCLQLALAILYIPWLLVLLQQFSHIKGNYWMPRTGLNYLVLTFVYMAGSTKLLKIFAPFFIISVLNLKLDYSKFPPKKLVGPFKNLNFRQWLAEEEPIYLLGLWLFCPVLIPFISSQFMTPIFHYRYTIIASSALYLLVAKGIRNIGFRYIRLAIVLAVVVFSSLSLKGYYSEVRKEQWREVSAFIDVHARPGDLVLVHQNYCLRNVFNYYSRRTDLTKKPFPVKDEFVDSHNIQGLEPALQGYNRVWLILSHKNDPNDLILTTINRRYGLIYNKKFFGVDLYLFEKPNQGG